MKRNRSLATITLFAAALYGAGTASCGLWKRGAKDRIAISGNIELTQINLAFKIPGKLVDLPIEEGAEIPKGAVVARLDAVQLQQQRLRDQAGLALAETLLVQQRTGIEYQKAALAADLDVRAAALRQAEIPLEQLLAGSRKQEIEQVRAAAEEIRTQNMQARAAVALSEAARIELRRREQELDSRRTQIEQARAQLLITEAQLADTAIASPINGVVLVKSTEAGERLADEPAAEDDPDGTVPFTRRREAFGRDETEARAHVHPASPSADSVPGRTDQRRRSRLPA